MIGEPCYCGSPDCPRCFDQDGSWECGECGEWRKEICHTCESDRREDIRDDFVNQLFSLEAVTKRIEELGLRSDRLDTGSPGNQKAGSPGNQKDPLDTLTWVDGFTEFNQALSNLSTAILFDGGSHEE